MKYLRTTILTGLMIHLLPLSAEYAEEEEETFSELTAGAEEEEQLNTLEEELSLLDEEFDEFKDELNSIEEALRSKNSPSFAAEQPELSEEPVSVAREETPAQEVLAVEVTPVQETPEVSPVLTVKNDPPATLSIQSTSAVGEMPAAKNTAITVDLKQAFAGSPIIYSILLAMSVFAVCLWLYSMFSVRSATRLSSALLRDVRGKLGSNQIEESLSLCTGSSSLFCRMVSSGIQSRGHGLPVMLEAMKAEGKRSTSSFWQKIGLLSDIAIIAPMLGLLGTVLGMFYAFYNVNRSIESISILFDGLGISVGTTVAGLVVAIVALILHSTAKYNLVRALAQVENEAQSVAVLIDDRTSILKG